MSNNRKDSGLLGKIAIGVAGIIGGILIGKAVTQITKQQVPNSGQMKFQTRRVADSVQYTKNIQDYDTIEQLMTCPITNCLMKNPAIISQCGHTFQKQQIYKWVQKNKRCPLCKVLTNESSLKPNYQLQQIIAQYLNNKKQLREKQLKQEQLSKKQVLPKVQQIVGQKIEISEAKQQQMKEQKEKQKK